ncbi:MAG: hypothetical protein E6240_01645 [Clostridium butyricum]|nr:hypothetical protein [Clostridium butyricum]
MSKVYKAKIKKFLGQDVRTITDEYNKTWLVVNDFFSCLGRNTDNGNAQTSDIDKMDEFLKDIGKTSESLKLTLAVGRKKKNANNTQNLNCISIDVAPILTTQFKPIKSNKRTEEENEEIKNKWIDFMKFVNQLLEDNEAHKFIITDKENQKTKISTAMEAGGDPMKINMRVNKVMAQLLNLKDKNGKEISSIKKDELKIFQANTTIDLLKAREYVLDKFVNAFEITSDYDLSEQKSYQLAKKHYNL